jgi:hypothetical protein
VTTGDAWWETIGTAPGGPVRESVRWRGGELRAGDQVRLAPRDGADIMDIALRGRTATVESIEMDFEDVVHVAVTVDDDPGRDLGMLRQPGHRFFFLLDEIEPVEGGR